MNPNIVYKYRCPKHICFLPEFTFRLSPISDLNDPYECLAGIDEHHVRKFLEESGLRNAEASVGITPRLAGSRMTDKVLNVDRPSDVAEDHAKKFYTFLDSLRGPLGICSFSANCISGPMWAHYGQKHQGFAVGLNANDSFMRGEERGPFGPLVPVHYRDERVEPYGDDPDWMYKVLMRKGSEWEYEEEWRFVRWVGPATRKTPHEGDGKGRIHPIPRRVLKEVVFGEFMADDNKQQIRKVIAPEFGYESVKFFQATRSLRTFKMDIDPA